jgi:hypothetical protein
MSNFRGTRGKWKRVKFNSTEFYKERNEIHYGNDGECIAEHVKNDYDALLISKSPEMLEMLEKFVSLNPQSSIQISDLMDEAEKLIKKATEL